MNRKGFTLMELLLVVAVLAIVAAAAAPTFFGGAQEAMNEARKSSFMSAYQNTLTGANLYISTRAAKGEVINDGEELNLDNYTPQAARTYNLGNESLTGYLKATYVDANSPVKIETNGGKTININVGQSYEYSEIVTMISGS